jgi:hypothetical protein
MKFILSILAIAMSIGMQGCATVTKGTTDTIQVNVSNCGESMYCTASNKKGSWSFTAPGPVTFKKSDNDLVITCDDGGAIITQRLKPTRGGMIWGNVLIGGIIGGTLDAITDAHWNTADSLTFNRNNCYAQQASTSYRKVQSKNTETKSQQNSKETTIPVSTQSIQVPAQQTSTSYRKVQSNNTETKSQQNSKETTTPASKQRIQAPAQPKPRIKEVDTHEIRYIVGEPSGQNHNSSTSGGIRKQQSQGVVSQSADKGTSKQTGGNQNDSSDAKKTEWVREVGGKKFYCVRSANQTICR